ncbi:MULTISPECIES: hypothetical protein [unclassified Lysinibacillus]|uniref:hypothetical protein n=1 Tax=unclassified Lysinibacillus TaxID=2636778 RepID=UPI00131ED541|nr:MULTISPECIES: hypothetical protein [unclassified Lysinibacillus]
MTDEPKLFTQEEVTEIVQRRLARVHMQYDRPPTKKVAHQALMEVAELAIQLAREVKE